MKRLILLLMIIFPIALMATERKKKEKRSLKIASYFLRPDLTELQATEGSKFDLVILSHGNLYNSPGVLDLMKELNPDIKLFSYINPWEIHTNPYQNQPLDLKVHKHLQSNEGFYLKQADESPVVFWEGMEVLNMSTDCEEVDGKNYSDYILDMYDEWIIQDFVIKDDVLSGIYMDNPHRNISWLKYKEGGQTIDLDNDQVDDDNLDIDRSWRYGMESFLAGLKDKLAGKEIIGNTVDLSLVDEFDLFFFENFPNKWLGKDGYGGWLISINRAARSNGKAIINIDDEKDLMFGMCSALLVDAYFSLNQSIEWRQEYDMYLGPPKGPMQQENSEVFSREFKKGKVSVYPFEQRGEIKWK